MWAILLPRAVFVSVVLLRRVAVWMGSVLPLKAILRSMVCVLPETLVRLLPEACADSDSHDGVRGPCCSQGLC